MARTFKKLDVSRILDDANILDVAEDLGLEMKPQGRNMLILCPCHPDRHFGSCKLLTDKNIFYCHACHAHGDAIGLVKAVEGVDFKTAAKRVADICGGAEAYYHDVEVADEQHTRLPKDVLKELGMTDTQSIRVSSVILTESDMETYKASDNYRENEHWEKESYQGNDEDDCTVLYFLKEPVIKKPLQTLIDEDPEMFDVLVYNKAVEKLEGYENLASLAKGHPLLSRVIPELMKPLTRIIDEYERKVQRITDPELKALIYVRKPKEVANPFRGIRRCIV